MLKKNGLVLALLNVLFTLFCSVASASQLTFKVDYIEDRHNSLHIDEILLTTDSAWTHYDYQRLSLNLGQTTSALWLRVQMCQSESISTTLPKIGLIELGHPYLSEIQFYSDQGHLLNLTGHDFPLASRLYLARDFVYPVTLSSCPQSYYFKVTATNRLFVPVRLMLLEEYEKQDELTQLFYHIYYGLIGVVALYFFAFSLAMKQTSFFYYSVFCLLLLMGIMIDNGLFRLYIWPNAFEWNQIAAIFFYSLVAVAGLRVTKAFLNTRTYQPTLNNLMSVAEIYFLSFSAFFLVYFLFDWNTSVLYPFVWTAAPIAGILIVMAAWRAYRKKLPSSGIYLIAWLSFWGGVLISMLLIFDWIPASFWTSHALMLSSMVEVIFISWAMADRVAQTHKEKDKAIQLMQKADHERLEVLRESESRLADEVSRKTRQLQQSLSREMTRHQQFKKLTEMVSHEFRNPLYVMLGRIDLIEKMVSSIGLIKIEDIMPHVTVIKNNGKKIEALLDQWNQQDGVKELFFVPKLEKKEVSTMLKSICIDAERLFPDHCIEFCNVTARVECMVDAELLRIVIFNLIQNACKYSENNTSVQISLTTNAIECEIRVCDEGCGIASDEQSLIFDEYYRSPQHHSKQHGQGLGLVLVKHIVEGHNGRIQVQSEVGKGSCFSVFLQIVSGLK